MVGGVFFYMLLYKTVSPEGNLNPREAPVLITKEETVKIGK